MSLDQIAASGTCARTNQRTASATNQSASEQTNTCAYQGAFGSAMVSTPVVTS